MVNLSLCEHINCVNKINALVLNVNYNRENVHLTSYNGGKYARWRVGMSNEKLIDLFFKVLATGFVPVLFWVNSLSVGTAVMKNDLDKIEKRVVSLETEQKKIHDSLKDNQASLREMRVTVEFIKNLLMEIRTDIRRQDVSQ